MTPATYNFPVFPGADISWSLDLAGMDLTDYTARASLRPAWNSQYVLSLEVTVTKVLTNWRISLFAPASATTGMERIRGAAPTESSPYYWDLELVAPDGKIDRLLQGANEVKPEATR